MKSAAANPQSSGGLAPNAVLCTHSQTFQIRQVQSSNSLYILQPSSSTLSEEYGALPLGGGVSAIAQCNAILEAVPSFISPNTYLKQILPVYHGNPDEAEKHALTEPKSKKDLLKDAPFSQKEFEDSLVELCAFEFNGQTYLPSAEMQLKTWKAFMDIVTLESIDIRSPFSLPDAADEEETEHVPTLLEAMLELLKSDDDATTSRKSAPLYNAGSSSSSPTNDALAVINLDPSKIVPYIGGLLLKSSPSTSTSSSTSSSPDSIPIHTFLQAWCDLLPESWREDAKVEALKVNVAHLGDGMIALQNSAKGKETSGGRGGRGGGGPSGPSGRWHEKFRSS